MIYFLRHCPPNPTFEYADSIELPKNCRQIIAQGGGSTIDVGKWLSHKYKIPLCVIPTTAGTGSEVTRYCVLTTNGKKKTYDLKLPESYILNPQLVTTLPELHTVASGLDALSQAMEALWSKNATKESRIYSNVAIQLVENNLSKSLSNPENEQYRMNMLLAANFSGRAIEITKTNVCHAISYPLTDIYNIPHGIACAMSLRYFANKFLGIDLTGFFDEIGIPMYGFDIETIVQEVKDSPKLKDCPMEVTEDDIRFSLA